MSSVELSPRGIARLVFVGGLLLTFVIMLLWAFNPDEEGGIRFSGERGAATDDEPDATGDPSPSPEPEPEPDPEPEATEEPEDTGLSDEEIAQLIEAAPDPGTTSVQVLDAGGGGGRANAAADALRELGYNVVNVTSARADVATTTIWFNEGHEEAAQGMRARDQRVGAIEPNQALSTGVDLHVLVGPDWDD